MCPLGTFWRVRLLMCKMLSHKNEMPILRIRYVQHLVAVVMTAVCLTAGSYSFGCPKETRCLRQSRSSSIYPTCFLSLLKQWLLKAPCTADPALPCLLGLWEESLVPHQPKSKIGQIHVPDLAGRLMLPWSHCRAEDDFPSHRVGSTPGHFLVLKQLDGLSVSTLAVVSSFLTVLSITSVTQKAQTPQAKRLLLFLC